jgi:biopolymer transport protein ExbB
MDFAAAIQTLIQHGGFAAWLIIIAGFALVVVGLERVYTLYFLLSFDATKAIESIRSEILARKYTQAIQVCNAKPGSPELQVVKAGLMAVENGREAMKSALGASVLDVTHRAELRVQYLGLIANVATLLGLLGTITGLIKTFSAISNADPAEKAKILGMGISEAMYCTGAGLIVGIAAMVLHTVCTQKADTVIGQSQDAGLRLITWVEQSERAGT